MATGPTYVGGKTGQIGPEDLGELDLSASDAALVSLLEGLANLGIVEYTTV
ncbi:hypothetical protein [Phytoactinopolyspora halophila]|uniref:hypothetical protein n=1 Tax=Phytoactinopolyspora halophila TaxID=1981511 RepID=UPI001314F878|nr:hypothetical protein [Phytoactinopolyspora halophila]